MDEAGRIYFSFGVFRAPERAARENMHSYYRETYCRRSILGVRQKVVSKMAVNMQRQANGGFASLLPMALRLAEPFW